MVARSRSHLYPLPRETRSGTFSITDDAGTQTASLSGTGCLPATDALSPPALTFAAQQLTTASAAQQVTLTNSGDLPLTLIAAQITSGDFTAVNTCGNSLNPHSSCSINVSFVAEECWPRSPACLLSRTNTALRRFVEWHRRCATRSLSSPVSTHYFSGYRSWSSAAAQTVTLTNNGGVPLLGAKHRGRRRFRYCAR